MDATAWLDRWWDEATGLVRYPSRRGSATNPYQQPGVPVVRETVSFALGLLARPGSDGRKVVQLPVSAQDGALYLGPVRVLKLRPIPLWAPSARRIPPGASR